MIHFFQQNKHTQQNEPIDVVDFVGPERGENEVHFNEYRPKRQNSAQNRNHRRLHKPALLWNWPRDDIDTAWKVWLSVYILPNDRAH